MSNMKLRRAPQVLHIYNGAGSLVADKSRGIAYITYDANNTPGAIYFTNGSVTKYVYGATGEKLRVIYQTAVPNITVPIGSVRELSPSEILSTDSTDYLLGVSLTLRNLFVKPNEQSDACIGSALARKGRMKSNGRIDKFQFDEGYCKATTYSGNTSQDTFSFCYYDRDHLGNIRQVILALGNNGSVVQRMDYYPFGAQLCGGTTDSDVQSHRYNGKELDKMHGLNTYDYGARQYNPVTARWDRMDPLCEKYYNVSPYAYCGNNPIMCIDTDGCLIGDYYDTFGDKIGSDGKDDEIKHMVIDYKDQKIIKQNEKKQKSTPANTLSSVVFVPSDEIIGNMEIAYNKTEDTGNEHGFMVGVYGTVTTLVTGTEKEISNWEQPLAELREKDDYVAYDVHTHSKGNSDYYGLAKPSSTDLQNVIKSSGLPSIVLGYREKPVFHNPNMIGGSTNPELERAVVFYNSKGIIGNSISFDQYKRAVKKINKRK